MLNSKSQIIKYKQIPILKISIFQTFPDVEKVWNLKD